MVENRADMQRACDIVDVAVGHCSYNVREMSNGGGGVPRAQTPVSAAKTCEARGNASALSDGQQRSKPPPSLSTTKSSSVKLYKVASLCLCDNETIHVTRPSDLTHVFHHNTRLDFQAGL